MSVRFGAGGALRRDSNCETYDSVTWAARARSRCPSPSSCKRCRMINGTSTGLLLDSAAFINSIGQALGVKYIQLDKNSKARYVLPSLGITSSCLGSQAVAKDSRYVRHDTERPNARSAVSPAAPDGPDLQRVLSNVRLVGAGGHDRGLAARRGYLRGV